MGQKFVLVGDMGTDHDGFPPTPVTAGSATVIMDGKPMARVGDPLEPHDKPNHPKHPRAIAQGSGTILIDGKPAALTGHAVDCGGVVIGSGSGEGGSTITGGHIASSALSSVAAGMVNTNGTHEASSEPSESSSLSSQGENWLKGGEELRLQPYDDQTGRPIERWVPGATIGYGHLISRQEWPTYKDGITREQAEQVFQDDISPFIDAVNRAIKVPLEEHQADAAYILAYNIGIGGFNSSSVAKLLNDPEAQTPYASLEDAWKAWNISNGQVNQGLINRRKAEWDMFSKGVYETW
ncbi:MULTISPECIES: type VI secretion system PAAR protein [unclassified Halomonas]|uniref:type VI secretion system PAAR protein n=1 Tax=unclassified Halomonas TaxID=2609666 RepID=UPI00209D34A4|nr:MULTISPECIES: type VI secretion system PAAR protein [unclassified Halomonas]MCP1316007.1 type VI secretion system PAAR protein [Halomonas sp. 707D7]MCP1328206.1 type VI secretion system PAAR protein [Halomonas sp. 707D4]